jgi:hypothetical protein
MAHSIGPVDQSANGALTTRLFVVADTEGISGIINKSQVFFDHEYDRTYSPYLTGEVYTRVAVPVFVRSPGFTLPRVFAGSRSRRRYMTNSLTRIIPCHPVGPTPAHRTPCST